MARFFQAVLLGLIGAGIVHIAILFLLPHYTQRDAWSRLADKSGLYAVTRTDGAAARPISGFANPLFETAACRFDLSQGAVHVHAKGHVPFWSMSAYGRTGLNIYSLNDRTTTDRSLDFVIVSPEEMVSVRKELPPEFASSIFVEANIAKGIVVIRTLVPDPTWKPQVASFMNSLTCDPQQHRS